MFFNQIRQFQIGIREALDEAEKIGVEKSMQAIADSDLRLMVVDSSLPWSEEDGRLLAKIRPLGSLVMALNKSDLPRRITEDEIESILSSDVAAKKANAVSSQIPNPEPQIPAVATSALTGVGIHELQEMILQVAAPGGIPGREADLLTNFRHQQLITNSLQALAKAKAAVRDKVHHEMLLLDLYDALRPLDRITGATDVEDVLGIIFSTFCVGK